MPERPAEWPAAGCTLCPRQCRAARTPQDPGLCGAAEPPGFYRVARLMAHPWEEPWISGSRGSGTIFFSGCGLGCLYCQNAPISLERQGILLDQDQLIQEMMALARLGVHNLNLVTASHYASQMPSLVAGFRSRHEGNGQALPVVWNSSAYETEASLEALAGTVDIFLPDLKYADESLSADLSRAPDYFAVASRAILMMQRLQPQTVLDDNSILRRGLVVRHLVLPGHWRDSCLILDFLADRVPPETPLSLMCQYTPPAAARLPANHPELARRLTTLEYRKVLNHALELGFSRIIGQQRSSADLSYTPDFSSLWGAAGRIGRT